MIGIGIGQTGCYVDDKGNEYAATVIGRTFEVRRVWRDAEGKEIPAPAAGEPPPPGAVLSEQPVRYDTGNLELEGIFRDGTRRIFSNVDPIALLEPGRRQEEEARALRGDYRSSSTSE
jgi:hypothetical protein